MDNIKVKYLSGLNLTSIFRNLYGIVRAKFTTIFLGIYGVGILGQISTFFGVQNRLVTFGVEAFLINKIPKIHGDDRQKEIISILYQSFLVLVIINLILLAISVLLIEYLTKLIFVDSKFELLFILLILLGPVYAVANIFEIISQAKSNFKALIIGRNIATLFGIVSFIPLVMFYEYYGIVYSLYIFTISGGIYFLLINRNLLHFSNLKYFFYVKNFLSYFMKIGFTDMSRKILVFVSLMVFRIFIVQFLGVEQNGLFQAIWSISLYPDIIIGAFVTFYFPTISGAMNKNELKHRINNNFEYAYYLVLPVLAIIMIIPDIFLLLFFDGSFLVVEYDLKLLIFFKIFQIIYTFFTITFLGQTYLRRFLVSEVVRTFSLVLPGYILIPLFALKGAVLSIIIMQCISVIPIVVILIRDSDFRIEYRYFKELIKASFLLVILIIPHEGILIRIGAFAAFVILAYFLLDLSKYKHILKTILPAGKR